MAAASAPVASDTGSPGPGPGGDDEQDAAARSAPPALATTTPEAAASSHYAVAPVSTAGTPYTTRRPAPPPRAMDPPPQPTTTTTKAMANDTDYYMTLAQHRAQQLNQLYAPLAMDFYSLARSPSEATPAFDDDSGGEAWYGFVRDGSNAGRGKTGPASGSGGDGGSDGKGGDERGGAAPPRVADDMVALLSRFGLGRYGRALQRLGADSLEELRCAEFPELREAGIPPIKARLLLRELRKGAEVEPRATATAPVAGAASAPMVVSADVRGGGAGVTAAGRDGGGGDGVSTDAVKSLDEAVLTRSRNADGTLQRLGHGAFGVVYRGVLRDDGDDEASARSVAIKVQHREGVGGRTQTVRDVMREVTAHSRVGAHPNVVRFVGLCWPSSVSSTLPWMVLEVAEDCVNLLRYVKDAAARRRFARANAGGDVVRGTVGRSVHAADGAGFGGTAAGGASLAAVSELEELGQDGVGATGGAELDVRAVTAALDGDDGPCPLPAAEQLDIALQLARGLAHIHACGITHRDFAARNILRSPDGTLRITDFGLARGHRGVAESLFGPVLWEAPEIHHYRTFGPESDVWAWGCVMCEVLSGGEEPWALGSDLDNSFKLLELHRRVEARLTPADALPRGAAGELESLLRRAFARYPHQRCTMADVITEITELQALLRHGVPVADL